MTVTQVNLQELEEKYGTDLAGRIEKEIKYAEENNHAFKVEIVNDGKYICEIVFATSGYAYIYSVSPERKKVIEENNIGWSVCKQVSKLMESI